MTLLGAVIDNQSVLVAADGRQVSPDPWSEGGDWSDQDKLYARHNATTSLVWGWYGSSTERGR
jgi:hypothetical protein